MRLALRESGVPTGPPVVFLHAFPLASGMWEPQREAMKSFRVLAPDMRGFGKTPLVAPFLIEHMVDDVLETLDGLGVPQAVFVGNSMGGYVALRLAEKAPQRVRALVLCDSRAEADGNEVLARLTAGDVHEIPVMEAGRLVGIICPTDVLRGLPRRHETEP